MLNLLCAPYYTISELVERIAVLDAPCPLPLRDSTFGSAVRDCLSVDPVGGLCVNKPYGAMPNWDVSHVTDMSGAFQTFRLFNADISRWNVSFVTNFAFMFEGCGAFNQPLGRWNTRYVTRMNGMFSTAAAFNQSLAGWDMSRVEFAYFMFEGAAAFDQDILGWSTPLLTARPLAGSYGITAVSDMFLRATAWQAKFERTCDVDYEYCSNTLADGPPRTWQLKI